MPRRILEGKTTFKGGHPIMNLGELRSLGGIRGNTIELGTPFTS